MAGGLKLGAEMRGGELVLEAADTQAVEGFAAEGDRRDLRGAAGEQSRGGLGEIRPVTLRVIPGIERAELHRGGGRGDGGG